MGGLSVRRGATVGLAAAILVAAAAGTARAVSLLTLTVSPLTVTAGQSTTFLFTAMNVSGPPTGCLDIEVAPGFTVDSVGSASASDESAWLATTDGAWLEATSASGSDFLDPGESVSLSAKLTATTAGASTWHSHIHVSNQCTGTAYYGSPVSVLVLPAPSPTPAPTPDATPGPTPRPDPGSSATPEPSATPTPVASPDPTRRPTPGPEDSPGPAIASGTHPPPSGSVPVARVVSTTDGGNSAPLSLGVDAFAVMDGPLMWVVPGAAVGVPGLLVLLFVSLQAAGALAWIPAVRRMGGDPERTRRRRRAARPAGG
jgi:hypothetical protein